MNGFENFHFLRPEWLGALALLIPLVWFARRRQGGSAAWRRVCDPGLLKHLLVEGGGAASRLPLAALAFGWLIACIAAAGPTWQRLPTPAYDDPEQTVLVLSLAESMNASDVAPARIVRARHKVLDALTQLDGAVGLVIYAEDAYPVTPLTDDAKVIAQQVPLLEPSLMPGRGARLGPALDEAQRLLGATGSRHGRILLLGDGLGDAPAAALAAAERSADAGYPVSALGIGGDFEGLEALARAGGGQFAALRADDADLQALLAPTGVFDAADVRLTRTDVETDAWRDAGAWLVLIPLLLAPFAFRRGWTAALGVLALTTLSAPPQASASVADWFSRPDQRAATAFEAGDYTFAADAFEDPAWRAAAEYRDGSFEDAAAALQDRADARSQYNLGNALAQAQQFEQAIAAYDQVLSQDPDHEDATFNRALVEKLLEEQKQQQEQQQQQEPQPQSSDSDADSQDQDSQPDEGEQADDAEPSEADQKDGSQGDAEQKDAEPSDAGEEDGEPSNAESQSAEPDAGEQDEPDQTGAEQQAAAQDGSEQESQPDETSPQQAAAGETSADPETGSEPQDAEPGPAPLPPTAQAEPRDGEPDTEAAAAEAQRPLSESDQELEQWLNRVPDDPGALLREKLRRRYVERRTAPTTRGTWR